LDSSKYPRTNGIYYRFIDSLDFRTLRVIKFFSDGFINESIGVNESMTLNENLIHLSSGRDETGTTKGYYMLEKDSIYFTLMSFYNHKETYCKGLFRGDSLFLEVKRPFNKRFPSTKETKNEAYVFFLAER
jgi:hypothetical protein